MQINQNELKSLINLNNIQDNIHEEKNEFTFVNHVTQTQNFKKTKLFLIKRFIKKNTSFHDFFHTKNYTIKNKQIELYFQYREQFLLLLLSIIHLTTNSLARDEEIIKIKYKNSIFF